MNTLEELQKIVKNLQRELHSKRTAPNYDFLTEQDVCEWLGCSKNTLKNYMYRGLLAPVYPKARKKFRRQDVIAFMKGMGKSYGVLQKRH